MFKVRLQYFNSTFTGSLTLTSNTFIILLIMGIILSTNIKCCHEKCNRNIMFDSENKIYLKWCKNHYLCGYSNNCRRRKNDFSKYCLGHTCTDKTCVNAICKNGKSRFCYGHTCGVEHCNNNANVLHKKLDQKHAEYYQNNDTTLFSNFNICEFYCCQFKKCNNLSLESRTYCQTHKCKLAECNNEIAIYRTEDGDNDSEYCKSHLCRWCGDSLSNTKIPCDKCICTSANCNNPHKFKSLYCQDCKCDIETCQSTAVEGALHCSSHKCKIAECDQAIYYDENTNTYHQHCQNHLCMTCFEYKTSDIICHEHCRCVVINCPYKRNTWKSQQIYISCASHMCKTKDCINLEGNRNGGYCYTCSRADYSQKYHEIRENASKMVKYFNKNGIVKPELYNGFETPIEPSISSKSSYNITTV
jgi:hypothetical protein